MGTKRHIVIDRNGLHLAITLTGANRYDSMELIPVVDAIPPLRGKRGRPRQHLDKAHTYKAYDFPRCRRDLRKRGITPRIARRGIEGGSKREKHRWIVEWTFAWINRFRRLTIRYERHADLYRAFFLIAATIICFKAVNRFC